MGGFGTNDGSMGHAVVIRGYESSSNNASLTYMDPNENTYQAMTVKNDGIYQFDFEGRT